MRAPSSEKTIQAHILWAAVAAMACMPAALAAAPKLTTIHTFTGGADGANPHWSGLVPGKHGSFFGETIHGGARGAGTVFEMTPPPTGGSAWTFTTIYTFKNGADGLEPQGLIGDPEGNLYGDELYGGHGPCGCGLVFELSPPTAGQAEWTKTVLHTFKGGDDGAYPRNGLARDAGGNLFGSTVQGGTCGDQCSTVFELSPPEAGKTAWKKTTLYNFSSVSGGLQATGVPLLDSSGALYGITIQGGSLKGDCLEIEYGGCGVIYKLNPPTNGATAWTETTVWRFTVADGVIPYTTLNMDANGNLFGLTNGGGLQGACANPGPNAPGCGTVFELSPATDGKGAWKLSLPWEFTGGRDGNNPFGAGLTPYHNKYITSTNGNDIDDFGTIDMFSPPENNKGKWAEQTLFTFTNDANGENPGSRMLQYGNMFIGMTAGIYGDMNGPASYGTVFVIKP
jgi:hypothetical protein